MSYLLIMNPGSRSGKGRRLWESWESGLRSAGAAFQCAFTTGVGNARDLARDTEADVVVAVGGDGTINEVLDGVIQSRRPDLQMGVLYSGASPDFCQFHRIPLDPKKAVEALLSGRARAVDIARITFRDSSNGEQIAHFGCSCNIGMGASVARHANRWRRYLGDVPGTGSGVICSIARNARVDLELEMNGSVRHLSAVNNLSVAKNPYIASGLKLRLPLDAADDKLFLVGIHGKSRLGILKLVPHFYDGTVTDAAGVFVEECSSVSISSKVAQEIEFDGDPRGFLPARIELLPGALRLIGGADEGI